MNFINSFQSEWLKKRKSAASWLTNIGGFFIPLIILVARMTDVQKLYDANRSQHLWESLSQQCWQFMAVFLLPMGVILASSLITQLEFKNNTWKQVHTTPQSFTTIFFTKPSVIMLMMLKFFILFNIGIYLAAVIPSLLFKAVPYPEQAIPFEYLLKQNVKFFIDCLPIIALQYMISLLFRNFLVPVGAGLGILIASMIAVSWKYGYIVPYSYCTINFLGPKGSPVAPGVNIHVWALGYFLLFTTLSYILYVTKKEKG